ncbi:MAG: hypothetical protein ACRESS_08700 [Stenotrophobium sp.]
MPVYKQCIQDYVTDRKQAIKQFSEQIMKNTDAANTTIKEFNDFNNSVSDRQ